MLTEILAIVCGVLLLVVVVLAGYVRLTIDTCADLQRNRAAWQRRAWSAERDLLLWQRRVRDLLLWQRRVRDLLLWQRRVRDLEGAAIRVLCALDAASLASDLEALRTVLTEPIIVGHNEENHGRKRLPDTGGADCRTAE